MDFSKEVKSESKFNENYLSLENTRFLRGIFAIVVIIFHYMIFNYNYGFLAVGGFFFLSGYGLMHNRMKKKDYMETFVEKRFTSIIIPYLLAVLFCLAMYMLFGGYSFPFTIEIWTFSPSDILLSFFVTRDSIVIFSWFVSAIVFQYIAFYILFKHLKVETAIVFFVIFLIVYSLALYSIEQVVWMVSTPCFLLGIILAYGNQKEAFFEKLKKYYWVLLVISTLIFLLSFSVVFKKMSLATVIYPIIAALSLMFLLSLVLMKIKIKSRIFDYIGKISFEVYLTHYLCIVLIKTTMDIDDITGMLLSIMMAIVFGTILYTIDSKVLSGLNRLNKEKGYRYATRVLVVAWLFAFLFFFKL